MIGSLLHVGISLTSCGYVKFTPKNIIVGWVRFVFKGCNLILLVTEGCMHNFRTLGKRLLGENKVHPQT